MTHISENTNYSVLIVDDEEPIRRLLKSRFEREGLKVYTAENVNQAIETLATDTKIAVIVSDIKMPGRDGLSFLSEIKQKNKSPKFVMMTGHGEKSTAISALKSGATDYLEKPFDTEEMSHAVKRALNEYRLERENEDFVSRLEERVARVEGKNDDQFWFVSKSKKMEPVNEWLKVLQRESLRGSDAEEPSTLIIGDSGTGKEGIARMIHAGSRRAKGAWVAVNCANFSEQLLESELFGHEKGSFTGATTLKKGLFEIAKGGTLFLDEVGEMDSKLQSRLLRVLQEKNFRRVGGNMDIKTDVRIIAATNQNLNRYITEGKFRDDLYHRLSRVVIEVPALKERTEDIIPMSKQFFENAFRTRGKKFEGLSSKAEEKLQNYSWPGNVRELLNVVERTALLWSRTGLVTDKELLIDAMKSSQTNIATTIQTSSSLSGLKINFDSDVNHFTALKKSFSDAFEKEYLEKCLTRFEGNVSVAAKESGIDRSNFLRLLRRHQIKAQDYRQQNIKKAA